MAKKKTPKTVRVERGEAGDPVRIVHEFPPGTHIREYDGPDLVVMMPAPRPAVLCPYCRTVRVKEYSRTGCVIYFQCMRCVNPRHSKLSEFRVKI